MNTSLCEIGFVLDRQDETTHTTYPRNLDQEPVRGCIIGAIDGNTIKVLTASQQAAKEYGMSKTDGLHRTRFKRTV